MAVQVYIRVVEARGLKGVENNGMSDPYVVIFPNAKKLEVDTRMMSKHIQGTVTPVWHAEFIFSVKDASSCFALQVLDWNRFSSNKPLGKVEINLETLTMGKAHDEWRNLDTQGEVRAIIHLSPLSPQILPNNLRQRISRARIQLERSVYYPGETLRGCLVYSTLKPRKHHSVRVLIEGFSRSHFSSGTGSDYYNHHGALMLLSCTAAFVGSPTDKSETFSLSPGSHLYPFEFVLPLTLPPSTDPHAQFGQPKFTLNFNAYKVTAFVDVASKPNGLHSQHFRVLAHPNHLTLDYGPPPTFPVLESANVNLEVQGPAIAWAGELYDLSIKIGNHSSQPVHHFEITLESIHWQSAKLGFNGKFTRAESPWELVEKFEFGEFAGFPLAPGQSLSETVQIKIPAGLHPTTHSSQSPLLQFGYSIGVRLLNSDGTPIEVSGTRRFMVLLSDHYREFQHLTPPADAEGTVGKLITAPASPDLMLQLAPAPSINLDSIVAVGGKFPPIAGNPQAVTPPQAFVPLVFLIPTSPQFYLDRKDWQPGMVPYWIANPPSPDKPPFKDYKLDHPVDAYAGFTSF